MAEMIVSYWDREVTGNPRRPFVMVAHPMHSPIGDYRIEVLLPGSTDPCLPTPGLLQYLGDGELGWWMRDRAEDIVRHANDAYERACDTAELLSR